jgi:hypothetical protein
LLHDSVDARLAGRINHGTLVREVRGIGRADEVDVLDAGHGLRQSGGIRVVGHHDRDPGVLERVPVGSLVDHRLEVCTTLREVADQSTSDGSGRSGHEDHRARLPITPIC